MYNPFIKHPKEVNETYLQHMWCAIKFSVKLEFLSWCAFIHAIFPFCCKTTASDGIKELNDCMKKRNTSTTNDYGDDDWATPK